MLYKYCKASITKQVNYKIVAVVMAIIFINLNIKTANAQTVGLVLSGGGAKGMAHIGVLKALEEHNIPIDYISGTSIGAMVGGLYASGYSTEEIKMIFSSERFKQWSTGSIDAKYYYSYMKEINSEMISVKFKVDSTETKMYIPSSIVSPNQMDFAFMQILASPAAAANYDFDSLYIPFRCIATDIYDKKPVAFKKGYLPSAVRASMTFPLYFKPIEIDGRLMFDGGIYDNFPKKVLKEDFKPDILIGVKVASNYAQAEKDDIIGQLENMIAGHTDYSLDKEKGILIDIKLNNVKLMDFEVAGDIEKLGYKATMALMDSIEHKITRRVSNYERKKKRLAFRNKCPKLIFDEIKVEGLKAKQKEYIKKIITIKQKNFGVKKLKEKYNKIIAGEYVENMYPIAMKNETDSFFTLSLPVEKAKPLKTGIGGNFSLTDMNQAYIGASYSFFGRRAYKLNANLYIGQFYNSIEVKGRVYFPNKLFLTLKTNYSRQNFQKGRVNNFYEDQKNPYVVKNELYAGISATVPIDNNSILYAGYNRAGNLYKYYQQPVFKTTDTTDMSALHNNIFFAGYQHNTLNHRNYADKGRYVGIGGFFINGIEKHTPGSTSLLKDKARTYYNYFVIDANYERYFPIFKKITLGFDAKLLISNKPFLSNYTASLVDAPKYIPFPYAYTIFNEKYKANSFIALDLKSIYHITDYLSVHLEGQAFQVHKKMLPELQNNRIVATNSSGYTPPIYSARTALVYHSLVGPVYVALHYFQNFSNELYLSAGLGYYIFNKNSKDKL